MCRHIDCAWTYGNQTEVGAAFNQIFNKEGKIKRSDVFITTKLWNAHHKDVRGDCLESLQQLQLEYLDLYLMHWPAQGPGYEGKTMIPSIKVQMIASSACKKCIHIFGVSPEVACLQASLCVVVYASA